MGASIRLIIGLGFVIAGIAVIYFSSSGAPFSGFPTFHIPGLN